MIAIECREPLWGPEVTRACVIATVAVASVICATPASAEVMDKEQSVRTIWGWALFGSLAGIIAVRLRWWLGLASLPLAALGPARALVEFSDPYVGPAIAAEATPQYGVHAIAALVMVVAVHLLGWAIQFKARTKCR